MELGYSPLGSKTHYLYIPHLYPKNPSYFQAIKPETVLTCDEMHKTLKARKIADITFADTQDAFHVTNFIRVGILIVIFLLVFTVASSFSLKKLPAGPVDECEVPIYAHNINTGITDIYNLKIPCRMHALLEHDFSRFNISEIPLILTAVSVCSAVLTIFAYRVIIPAYRTQKHNFLAHRFNANMDLYKCRLSYVSDINAEVPARDVGIIFPYLTDKQLTLLTFSALKHARHYWKSLFIKKLDASLFSKKQLCIWRSFHNIMEASKEELSLILKNKFYVQVIGGDPKYFQFLIRALKPLNNEQIADFSKILKNQVLAEAAALKLKHEFKSIVRDVAHGKKLTVEIEKRFGKGKSVSEADLEPEMRYINQLMRTGKLKIKNVLEALEFLIHGKDMEELPLENYIIEKFSDLLKEINLRSILEMVVANQLNGLKLRIDEYLELNFTEQPIKSDAEFKENYLLSIKYDLTLYKNALLEYFSRLVSNFLPNINTLSKKTIDIVNLCELLFDSVTTLKFLSILENKIKDILETNPKYIECLYLQALSDNNKWLLLVIKEIFKEDPDTFIDHWSILPGDFLEIEVIET